MMNTSATVLLRRLAALLLAGALAACASSGSAPKHTVQIPASYEEPALPGALPPATDWWVEFGSPALSAHVATALANNADIGIANERVMAAQAQAQAAGASLFPSLSASLTGNRRKADGEGTQGGVSAGLGANYELDLWGANGAAAQAARFAVKASEADRIAARLSIAGAVVTARVELLALRARLVIADENIAIAQQVLGVVDSRHRNGAASSLDLSRQRNAVLGQQAALLPLQVQERQLLSGLAILLDQVPQGFVLADDALPGLLVPQVAPGLPSSLLLRRPDLLAAEAQLAAAHASLNAARAALLPSISLTASTGAASSSLSALLSSPAWTYAIGAQLLQSIFDGGRQRAQVAGASARERELVLVYRKTILAALAEVESALAAGSRLAAQEQLLSQGVAQARLSLQLAQTRYRAGADDLIVLLDAQRSLFQAQDGLVQLRRSRLLAALALFKALGGGDTGATPR
jgi:multidrug efflux system outer membrane protein